MIYKMHVNTVQIRLMITSRGKNGLTTIHVEIVRPLPEAVPMDADLELQLNDLHDELNNIEGEIEQGADLEGVIDKVKKAYAKAKEAKNALVNKAKKAIYNPQVSPKPGPASHQNTHTTVELPEKLYDEMKAISAILERLLDAILKPDSAQSPEQEEPATQAKIQARPAVLYIIQ